MVLRKAKFILVLSWFLFGAFNLASVANAIPLSTIGSLDLFKANCGQVNGAGAELTCIEGVSGAGTVIAMQKFSNDGGSDLPLTLLQVNEDSNMYALLLPAAWRGDYFLLKTGNLSDTPGRPLNLSYVFENLVNKNYAVFKIDDPLLPFGLPNVGKVSHITAIQVLATPLPAAVWMFMAALGGIFGLKNVGSRFKKN